MIIANFIFGMFLAAMWLAVLFVVSRLSGLPYRSLVAITLALAVAMVLVASAT